MKAKEFIIELKKESKPRNFVAKNASLAGKAGQHKDKKKAEKQGDVKHKKEIATMESALNELSSEKLAQYKKAAGADAKKADANGNYSQGDKRFKGINKATNKQFDNDLKKHKEQGVAEGLFGIDDKIKGRIQNVVSDLSDIPGMWDHKAQTFTDAGMEKLKSALKNNPKYIKYALNLTYKDYEAEGVAEGWSQKYKSSINCSHPKGFSQKAHCAGKKKHNESMMTMEATCPDCGMCETHGSLNEIKKGAKDSNGFTKCWSGYHAAGTKKGKNGGQVRNCVPNESIAEAMLALEAELESLAEEGKASRKLCASSKPDSELGASQLASCKSQGLRSRDGNKSHKLGKSPKSRVKVGGHKIKGQNYGGPLPDWS